MTDNSSHLDQAAIDALLRDPHGPVGQYLGELAGRGADIARARVPRDTGHMAGTIGHELGHDRFDGSLRAWFSAGYEAPVPHDRPWAGGFPVINALEPAAGRTRNRHRKGRRVTWRRDHPFLTDALDALAREA